MPAKKKFDINAVETRRWMCYRRGNNTFPLVRAKMSNTIFVYHKCNSDDEVARWYKWMTLDMSSKGSILRLGPFGGRVSKSSELDVENEIVTTSAVATAFVSVAY